MDNEALVTFLKEHYPNTNTNELAYKLNMPLWKLKRIVSKNKIRKSPEYLKKLHEELMKAKKQSYLASIPDFQLTTEQLNILVGSLLGDGGLDFSLRSQNAYYKEHFSTRQKPYREWKAKKLNSLGFKICSNNTLKSPSHPIFTKLYQQFYINGIKRITPDNIKLLSEPIGLACLYFDDGTLILDAEHYKKHITLFPRITISTMSFTKEENLILIKHLKDKFHLDFNLKKVPYGKGYCLDTGKGDTIDRLLKLIQPFAAEIPCMKYKVDIEKRYQLKQKELEHTSKLIKIRDLNSSPRYYSPEDEEKIISLKKSGFTDKQIAAFLGRNYWGVVDKIRRLREKGRL